MYVQVYNHTTGIYHYLFSNNKFEISQVSISQKQAFSKRLNYVCNPTLGRGGYPCICTKTYFSSQYSDVLRAPQELKFWGPIQRGDCHAKKWLQLLCGCKGTTKK